MATEWVRLNDDWFLNMALVTGVEIISTGKGMKAAVTFVAGDLTTTEIYKNKNPEAFDNLIDHLKSKTPR